MAKRQKGKMKRNKQRGSKKETKRRLILKNLHARENNKEYKEHPVNEERD